MVKGGAFLEENFKFSTLLTGWINMFMYLIIVVFIGTLMIGCSPELFGKKVSTKEMQVATGVSVLQLFAPGGPCRDSLLCL